VVIDGEMILQILSITILFAINNRFRYNYKLLKKTYNTSNDMQINGSPGTINCALNPILVNYA
jgi:hypothetical protein